MTSLSFIYYLLNLHTKGWIFRGFFFPLASWNGEWKREWRVEYQYFTLWGTLIFYQQALSQLIYCLSAGEQYPLRWAPTHAGTHLTGGWQFYQWPEPGLMLQKCAVFRDALILGAFWPSGDMYLCLPRFWIQGKETVAEITAGMLIRRKLPRNKVVFFIIACQTRLQVLPRAETTLCS